MCDIDFVIPLKRDDLLHSRTTEQYYVADVYSCIDVIPKVSECEIAFKEAGTEFILKHFDVLFSVLQAIKELDFKLLYKLYNNVIIKSLHQLNLSLEMLLDGEQIDEEIRSKMLNVTKMTIYIAVQFLSCLPEKIDSEYRLVIDKKGKKKASKLQKLAEQHNWDWEVSEREAIFILNSIMQRNLGFLWDPHNVEEEFVSTIANSCYAILERPSIATVKQKPTRDIIFDVIGNLVKNYGHGLSCKVKIVQLLKLCEHLVTPLAQCVIHLVEEFGCRSLVKDLIIEIIDAGDVGEGYAQDSSSARTLSNFIVEVATIKPELILPCTDLLIQRLSCEPYSMRIGVLTVMSEIVSRVLCSETLSEEAKSTRDNFIDLLMDHITDIHVYVRSKVLKLWQRMWIAKAVPKNKVQGLLERAIRRLKDKSSQVSKYAIQLIGLMVGMNVYGAQLNIDEVNEQLRSVKASIAAPEEQWENVKANVIIFLETQFADEESEGNRSYSDNAADTPQPKNNAIARGVKNTRKYLEKSNYDEAFASLVQVESCLTKKSSNVSRMSVVEKINYYCELFRVVWKHAEKIYNLENSLAIVKFEELIASERVLQTDFIIKNGIVAYLQDLIKFLNTLSEAVPIICDLMLGKSQLEILEAINFFKVAKQYRICGADDGVRYMLLLVNSKEQVIKDAVVSAYADLYLENNENNARARGLKIVTNFIELLKTVSIEQKDALECLIKEWVIKEQISDECVVVLWELFTKNCGNSGKSQDDRLAAATIIAMVAAGKLEIISANIDTLITHGLESSANDYELVKFICQIFKKLASAKNAKRFCNNHKLFVTLHDILVNQFMDFHNSHYFETSMETIDVFYELAEHPDQLCESLLSEITKQILRTDSVNSQSDNLNCGVSEECVAKLLMIIGHVAFRQYQFLEKIALPELKRRNAIKCNSKNVTDGKKMRASGKKSANPEDICNSDELAAMDEAAFLSVKKCCEKELFSSSNLLGQFYPTLIKICETTSCGKRLRAAASIALSKFMLASSDLCDKHLQLFVTMMAKSKEKEVRTNLLFAFGDITFRFPNLAEPWTNQLFSWLSDSTEPDVKYATLLVISHLILNDMVKVKGQISEVALCIVDEDSKVRDLANQLFVELSTRGNTLYNIVPDIIYHLSNPDTRPSGNTFQPIVKILLPLITKDKHLESLVEKICKRFKSANDERQCVDLAFCLSLFAYNERMLQKILDNHSLVARQMHYPKVEKYIFGIINACKKQQQNRGNKVTEKFTQVLDELDHKLRNMNHANTEEENSDKNSTPKINRNRLPSTPASCKGRLNGRELSPVRSSNRLAHSELKQRPDRKGMNKKKEPSNSIKKRLHGNSSGDSSGDKPNPKHIRALSSDESSDESANASDDSTSEDELFIDVNIKSTEKKNVKKEGVFKKPQLPVVRAKRDLRFK